MQLIMIDTSCIGLARYKRQNIVSLQWRHNGHLKTPAPRLFTQPFIQTQIKEKNQSSASLAFERGNHLGPVNSPHKWPVTRNCFHLMTSSCCTNFDLIWWGQEWMESLHFYIWHCVPNILLWSILCKTVGLPSSTGESERTARRQFHSPTLRCFRGRLCEIAAGRGPLKQSRWPESNWTLPLRSVGVAPSLGRFWLVFTALKLRYVLRRHIILSDSDGNQGVLKCFTVYPGLGGSAK